MPRGFAYPRSFRGESDLRPTLQRNNRALEAHINAYIPSYDEEDGMTLTLNGDLITGGDISIPTGATVDGIDPSSHNHDGTGDNGMLIDHGDLVGRADDDHSQYLNDTRHEAVHKGTSVARSSVYGVPDSTPTIIPWNTETIDDGNWHSNGTNPSRITIDEDGWYSICAGIDFNTTSGAKQLRILVDGSTGPIDMRDAGARWTTIAYQRFATAGTYFEIEVVQASGSTQNVQVNERTYFSVVRL